MSLKMDYAGRIDNRDGYMTLPTASPLGQTWLSKQPLRIITTLRSCIRKQQCFELNANVLIIKVIIMFAELASKMEVDGNVILFVLG